MRRLARKIKDLFGPQAKRRRGPATRRLDVEMLEQRSVPTISTNASAVVLGTTFIDGNANGLFDAGEHVLTGATVTLTGTTYLNKPLSVTTTSDASGAYRFVNVPKGTYRLQFPSVTGFTAENGGAVSIAVGKGQTIGRNLGFRVSSSGALTLRQFLTNGTPISALPPLPTPGAGHLTVTGPTVKTAIANATFAPSTATAPAQVVDLAGFFGAPDVANSTIRINTNHGSFDMTLFDKSAPQTVANFYDYINSGAYNNSIFSRLGSLSMAATPQQVLQGGGAAFQTTQTGGSLVAVPNVWPTLASGTSGIPNEFGASNVLGTIAMAQSGSPNSGTNQFFFNLVNNASSLDSQKFAVFGKPTTQADLNELLALVKTPTQNLNETGSPADTALQAQGAGVGLNNVPLYNYPGSSATFANDTNASNFLLIDNIQVLSRPEVLTYSLVSNSNPDVLTASLTNERLSLTPLNATGKSTITVKVTDQYGSTTTTSFTVTVDSAPAVTVTLDNTTPNPGATVTATATPSDADHDPVSLTYVWKVNGTTVKTDTHNNIPTTSPTPDTDAFTLTNVKAGDKVTVTVTPNDGTLNGSAVTTTATVNTPPVITVLQITPASATASSTLTATLTASDANSDPITFTYVWTVNGTTVQTDSSTASKTDTLNTVTLQTGDVVKVTVTPNDGKIDGIPDSASVTIS